jgi:hypothetical protein
VYEAATMPATFNVASHTVPPRVGAHDLPAGDLSIEYPLGSAGTKSVVFDETGVRVAITHRGPFVEQLPFLVLSTDSLSSRPGAFTLRRGATQLLVHWTSAEKAVMTRTNEHIRDRTVVAIAIPGVDSVRYEIRLK